MWLIGSAVGAQQELEKRYEHGLPRLDPIEDMNIAEPAVSSAVRRIEQLEQQLSTNEVFRVCGLVADACRPQSLHCGRPEGLHCG